MPNPLYNPEAGMSPGYSPRFYVAAGICGVLGTLSYIGAVFLPLGSTGTYVLAMAWPAFSIVFIVALHRFLSLERPGPANDLALVFGSLAFTLVAAMVSAQLAVRMGIQEYVQTGGNEELLGLIRRSVRLVDLGMDVAWDVFIGTALVFLGAAVGRHSAFRLVWGVPAAVLGAGLIALNVATFPWPPADRELFDIGPAVGSYIIALAGRFILVARR